MRKKINKQSLIKAVFAAVFMLVLGGIFSLTHFLKVDNLRGEVVATATLTTNDATNPGLVSAIKFVDARNNYLAGIALDAEGFVWSWGYNANGVLGLFDQAGGYAGGMSRLKYFVNNDIKIVKIAAGYQVNYAIDDQGVLYAWGRNIEGQVGNGTAATNVPQPVKVAGLTGKKIVDVSSTVEAAGAVYAFADDGTAYAWGYADGFRIPNKSGYIRTPVEIPSISALNIKKFDSGDNHHIMLTTDGKVYTRGNGGGGQLGHGNATTQALPMEVAFFSDKLVLDVSVNNGTSMALVEKSDGTTAVYEWGNRLGYTGSASSVNLPTLVTFNVVGSLYDFMPKIVSITAGRYVNYATDEFGRVWSWGYNTYYSWGTDGPLPQKLNNRNPIAEQQPVTLGDGDTQGVNGPPKGPVFKGFTRANVIASFNSYTRHGQWSSLGDGLHPTIYDKKYSLTSTGANPNSHTDRYLLNREGQRVIYVLRRESDNTYSGNYYVAESSYAGSWIVDNGTAANLPVGITEVTSAPTIAPAEQNWISLAVDIDSDDWWDGYSMKEMPYVSSIDTYQSTTTFLDKSGNLYKTGLDGSGAVAWGWDYTQAYEGATAGNNLTGGLYNMYTYEVMFMRGAPTVNASQVDIKMELEKNYLSESKVETADITITLGEASHSDQLNLTIEPELTTAKYLIMPYDTTDPNQTISSPSREQFMAAYESASTKNYQAVDLISEHPEWTLKQTLYSPPVILKDQSIEVADNAVLWILTTTSGYSANIDTIVSRTFDNFYTDTTLFQKGQEYAEPKRKVYDPTSESIVKLPGKGDTVSNQGAYGLPLDIKGQLIGEPGNLPTFGYDKVKITAKPLTADESFYWLWHSPQENTATLTLNDLKYLVNEQEPVYHENNTYLFYYDENPDAYAMVHFAGIDAGTGERMEGFSIPSRKIPKRQLDKQLPQDYTTADYSVLGFKVVNGTLYASDTVDISQPLSLVEGKAVYTAPDNQTDITVVFIYEQPPRIGTLNIRQVILSSNKLVLLPSNGYLNLQESKPDDNWIKGQKKLNLVVPSGKQELVVAYKHYEIPLAKEYAGMIADVIVPQYYHYQGHVVTTADNPHNQEDKVSTPIALDFKKEQAYWVTVYLEPVNDAPGNYQWGEAVNSFGTVTLN